MMTPLVHVTLPDLDSNDVEAHFAPLVFMLEGLIKLNEWHLTRNHNRAGRGQEDLIPPILASGIYYQEDKPGREDWRDAPAAWDRFKKTGLGIDCDQIVCWRAGELRVAGIAAEPVIKWQHLTKAEASSLGYASIVPEDGLWLVHCCVRFPDGSIEDTSKILGMGGNFTNKS